MTQIGAKDRIFACIKNKFYYSSYDGTLFKDIAKEADVPLSLITYHFKTKNNIIQIIFEDFYRKINERLKDYGYLNINNALYRQIIISFIYNTVIFSDENNLRFYRDLRTKGIPLFAAGSVVDEVQLAIISDFNISLSERKMNLLYHIYSAGRVGFFNYIFNNDIDVDIFEIVSTAECIFPRLLGIEPSIIDRYVIDAQSAVKEIEYSDIKLLL